MKKYLLVVSSLFMLNQSAVSQITNKYKTCYSDKPFEKEKVFTKMLHKPHFKGGQDSFVNFLMDNINFQNLVSSLTQNERTYRDTARVKFIISKEGKLSDLSVTMTAKKDFSDEIFEAVKRSSCNWFAGGTERLLNGWIQFDIYFSIDRGLNELKTNIKLKEYDYADN